MSKSRSRSLFNLPLRGPAQLRYENRHVKVRRKGLALLYYLALQGPTRREVLADLLWGHNEAGRNLRVELHMLRQAFEKLGFKVFVSGDDPLSLPDFVGLDRAGDADEVMEGLEDVSSKFQEWLESQRSQLNTPNLHSASGDAFALEIAEQLRFPSLVIVKGPYSSGRLAFAQSLAKQLGVPFMSGDQDQGRAVRYIAMPHPESSSLLERILNDRSSIWVIERSSFGEDPRFVLALQESYPFERTHMVSLPSLTWGSVRNRLLAKMPFNEAAQIYLASGGQAEHLGELLKFRPESGFEERVPVPVKMRMAMQLEARYLSLEGRLALERLSIHPRPLTTPLIEALEATKALDELERRGWLEFDHHWRFTDNTTRRAIYAGLQGGRRQRYHQTAATHFAFTGNMIAEAYHRYRADGSIDAEPLAAQLSGWRYTLFQSWVWNGLDAPGSAVPSSDMAVGPEIDVLEGRMFGPGLQEHEFQYTWVRTPLTPEPAGIAFKPPDGPCLLRVHGNAYVHNFMGAGIEEGAVPLSLTVENGSDSAVVFAPVMAASISEGNHLILPASGPFEHWFYIPQGEPFLVQCAAEEGIVELSIEAYRAEVPSDHSDHIVNVYEPMTIAYQKRSSR